ncbi:hypothetical protein GCM10010106_39350 [Thermopolyspora flexuosa]|jgi:hypothetical protein|uniref:Peptidase inhibitor family I36 n=1 Tax=Thermopolyspora flexuosa TaxID=103836 RepID=A0A543J2E9_9ACTN|nr:hypothetical protein [Thermopolyspora flexuosa]TQM76972.1 hypothetical protein FHX40_3724 [Thermopolyspora flexuosa]GGM88237.1 hypothetical protein GCM10010106_39350 [Thermopolyspora flexuosa]
MGGKRLSGKAGSFDNNSRGHSDSTSRQVTQEGWWTKWEGIAAIVATVLGIGSACFYLYDRFIDPPGHAAPASARPTCDSGSICLWPEGRFGGKVWTWTPGVSEEGRIPDYLREHVGSFDAQAQACFVDSETGERRPVHFRDWSERYHDPGRFGRVMDTIKARC